MKRERRRLMVEHRQHPTTGDPEYTDEESEYLREAERFKVKQGRKYLTLCEALYVAKMMGYRKP